MEAHEKTFRLRNGAAEVLKGFELGHVARQDLRRGVCGTKSHLSTQWLVGISAGVHQTRPRISIRSHILACGSFQHPSSHLVRCGTHVCIYQLTTRWNRLCAKTVDDHRSSERPRWSHLESQIRAVDKPPMVPRAPSQRSPPPLPSQPSAALVPAPPPQPAPASFCAPFGAPRHWCGSQAAASQALWRASSCG